MGDSNNIFCWMCWWVELSVDGTGHSSVMMIPEVRIDGSTFRKSKAKIFSPSLDLIGKINSSVDCFDCFQNVWHCDDYCCLLETSSTSNSISTHEAIVGYRKKRCMTGSGTFQNKG